MRLSKLILVLSLGGVGAAGALVGCGSDTGGAGGGSGTIATTATGSTSTGVAADPCSPNKQCPAVKSSQCIALVDNSAAKTFTLRMASLTLTEPPALAAGLVKSIVKTGVTPKLPSCNLNGDGTFSWLLQFDTVAGTLKTGGAKPVADVTQGYSFVDEMVMQGANSFNVAPFTTDAPITGGKFAVSMGQDVIVPIYLDAMAKGVVLLPLHAAKLSGTVSADNNCIGQYNSKGLDPGADCVADPAHPAFIGADGKVDSDGALTGFITLEDADNVVVDKLSQTLCVLLSGNAAMYGDGGTTIVKCKRDMTTNKILFQGDWCAASDSADPTCTDSVKLGATFSASGVKAN